MIATPELRVITAHLRPFRLGDTCRCSIRGSAAALAENGCRLIAERTRSPLAAKTTGGVVEALVGYGDSTAETAAELKISLRRKEANTEAFRACTWP
jgi:hypothetical protein